MNFTLHPRPSPRHSEQGFTLIELLVATAMMVVVCGAAVTMLVSAMRAQPNGTKRADEIGEARSAIERITTDIRQAASAESASPSSVRLQTYCDNAEGLGTPCTVTYSCEDDECTRAETAGGAGAPSETVVVTGLESDNVFCYTPANPNPPAPGQPPKNGCGIASSIETPRFVGVSIQLPTPGEESVTVVEDGAALHNLELAGGS